MKVQIFTIENEDGIPIGFFKKRDDRDSAFERFIEKGNRFGSKSERWIGVWFA